MDPLRDAMYLRWEKRNCWVVTDYHDNVLAHLTTNGARELAESFFRELPNPFNSQLLYLGNIKALRRAKIRPKKKKVKVKTKTRPKKKKVTAPRRVAFMMRWVPDGGAHGSWEVSDQGGNVMHFIDRTMANAMLRKLGLNYHESRKKENIKL